MRILVIAPEQLPVPPVVGGSVETCIHAVTRKLAARGHAVTVISKAHRKLPNRSSKMGGRLRYVRIAASGKKAYLKAALRQAGRNYHIIQVENRPAFVPAIRRRFPRTPIVLSLHSEIFLLRLSRSRGNRVLQKVKAVAVVGGKLKKTFGKRHARHRRKFFVAHPGVDTSKFKPMSGGRKKKLRRKRGIAGTRNVLFAGRIVRRKGLHTLIRAISLLPSKNRIRVIVAGASWPGKKRQTPYMRKIKRLAKRLGVRMVFTGYVPPSRMNRIYQLADVFVLPTLYKEGFGLVNVEAMASGIPVIASRRGAIPEIIRNGRNGLLVSAYRSPAAFARAINRVLKSRSLAKRLASNGRRDAVRRFSWNRTAASFIRAYRRIARRI